MNSNRNTAADFYFTKSNWQKEIVQLRNIALECGLEETLKWGCPCYTFQNKNIVLIHVFKEYCAYLFFKGALMEDPNHILIQQTENVQSARQIRFTHTKEIVKLHSTLQQYIYEAIEIDKAGLKVALKKINDYSVPEEFKQMLQKNKNLQAAFNALTPGRQRAYLFYFSQPKLAKTKESRIHKSIPQILAGKGLND